MPLSRESELAPEDCCDSASSGSSMIAIPERCGKAGLTHHMGIDIWHRDMASEGLFESIPKMHALVMCLFSTAVNEH